MQVFFRNTLTRKNILTTFIVFLVLFILNFITSYGVVTIRNDNNFNIDITTLTPGSEDSKTINISPKTSSKKILKKGNYTIVATSDDKSTIAELSTGRLSVISYSPKLLPQKSAESLGSDAQASCSFEVSARKAALMPCDGESNSYPSTTEGGDKYSTLALPESLNAVTESIFLPYIGGALQFIRTQDRLDISRISFMGPTPIAEPAKLSLDLEKQETSKYSLATDTNDIKQKGFSVLSGTKIFYYRDFGGNPDIIDLTSSLNDDSNYENKIAMSGTILYVFNGISSDITLGDTTITKKTPRDQTLLKIDLASKKIAEKIKVDKNLIVRDIYSSGDSMVFSATKNGSDWKSYRLLDKKIRPENVPASTQMHQCETTKGNYIIYDKGVYFHESGSDQSWLVYKDNRNISNISCTYDNLYVATLDQETKQYVHYKILETDLQGERNESIFPIDDQTQNGIVHANLFKKTLYIQLLNSDFYENREVAGYQATNISLERDKKVATDYLTKKGLKLENYSIVFYY